MATLESDIEKQVVAQAQAKFGVLSLKLNVAGTTGWPDRIMFIPGGKPLFVEFKQKGGKPRLKQKHVLDFLKRLGYTVEIHDDAGVALRSIEKACQENTRLASEESGTKPGNTRKLEKVKPRTK